MDFSEIISGLGYAGIGGLVVYLIDKYVEILKIRHTVRKDKFALKFDHYAEWISESDDVLNSLSDSSYVNTLLTVQEEISRAYVKRNMLKKLSAKIILSMPKGMRGKIKKLFTQFFTDYKTLLESRTAFFRTLETGHQNGLNMNSPENKNDHQKIIEYITKLRKQNQSIIEMIYGDIDL